MPPNVMTFRLSKSSTEALREHGLPSVQLNFGVILTHGPGNLWNRRRFSIF